MNYFATIKNNCLRWLDHINTPIVNQIKTWKSKHFSFFLFIFFSNLTAKQKKILKWYQIFDIHDTLS